MARCVARLQKLAPRLGTLDVTKRVGNNHVSGRRITGGALQKRREAVWLKDPRCASCRRVVQFPHGFELDHKVPLYQGGEDIEENCQVLCVYFEVVDGVKVKKGCHAEKTERDLKI